MRPVPLWRRYDRLLGSDPSADVKDELRFHLETKVDDLVAEGWSPEDARKEAERQFGDILAVQHVGERIGEHMDRRRRLTDYWADALRDVRFTLRTLRRDAGFTVIAILILTLAIGANIAVFAVVNTLLLRPLPFPDAHQLVWIAPAPRKCGFACSTYSADAYNRFRAQSRSYQDVTGYYAFSTADNLRLTGHGDPQPATGIMVVGNFFRGPGRSARHGPPLHFRRAAARRKASRRPLQRLLAPPVWFGPSHRRQGHRPQRHVHHRRRRARPPASISARCFRRARKPTSSSRSSLKTRAPRAASSPCSADLNQA